MMDFMPRDILQFGTDIARGIDGLVKAHRPTTFKNAFGNSKDGQILEIADLLERFDFAKV